MIQKNMGWILILIGGICEVFWVSGLKYADSFMLYSLTVLGIIFSFTCAILALKTIEVSICYTVFVGIGAAGGVIIGIVFFHESKSILKIVCVAVIISSTMGLKILA